MTASVAAQNTRAMTTSMKATKPSCLTGSPPDPILEGRVRTGKSAEAPVKTWRTTVFLMATLAILAGCARSTSAVNTGTTAVINRNFCPRSTATLYVTNDGWSDVVIYILRGGSRYRLGDVTGVQSAAFQI